MSRFTKSLVVSPLPDSRTWVLHEEFGYDVGEEGSGDTVDVAVGFLTDFASVPRPLWWLFPPWGSYGNAAVIHDFCYWNQSQSRSEADYIFLEAMGVLSVGGFTRKALYYSVRAFGWVAWKLQRRRKARDVKKIALRMPEKSIQTRAELLQAEPEGS
jgi:hypothetical protein